ncbi:MAG: type II toxin-antitoxin system RelE/ParE family toxin [Lachnospiraceae bacterium]|nr:type II toxin-antitoxin system RelE/ParE family toxin [Lachnospiraceae bacterium]MCM1239995.1 type II toxin-antitoxin system RelE/ParE family toxin [Lachnospiraceae bacterium]
MEIIYSKQAIKFIKKQDRNTQARITTAISKLPFSGDIQKMQGSSGYRLRIGDFRVLFDINGITIDIIEIGNRGQIYKGV